MSPCPLTPASNASTCAATCPHCGGRCRIVAAGTHPISHWKDQEITDRARYKDIVNEMEDLARALGA